MANLKDLIVNGPSRFIGDIFGNKAQLTTLEAPTSAGGTTYGPGDNGQVLKSNGSSLYWANESNSGGTVTSVQVQATSPVVSSVNTAQSSSLNTTISLADGYGDTKNPYASKTKNYVLAAPSTANGAPSFRALVAADIPTLSITDKTSGTLTVARGGTGVESFTANSVIMSGSTTTAALTTRSIKDATAAGNLSTSSTSLTTERAVAYAIANLDVTAVGVAAATGNRYISQISEDDGKISATLATATLGSTYVPVWVDAGTIKSITANSVLTDLASTTAASTYAQNPRPGVTGTLGIANGGTGATTAADARTNLVTAMGNARIFYGTSSTAAATTTKVVTCAEYDALTVGDIIFVNFSATNSGAVASLKLNVNSTGDIPIKYLANATKSNLPGTGYILKDTPYRFVYDGTNWVMDLYYNTNTNTLLRTYASSTNISVPLIGQSSAASGTAAWTAYTSSYKDWYGVIPSDNSKKAMINLSTGTITVPGGVVADLTGNADTATAADLTTVANSIAYYTDTAGTFGSLATANGAAYATSANGALTFGTLPTAQGGTGNTSYTASRIIYTNTDSKFASGSIVTDGSYLTIPGVTTMNNNIVVKKSYGYDTTLPADSASITTGRLFFTPSGGGASSESGGVSLTTDKIFVLGIKSESDETYYYNTSVFIENNVLMGAAWNDYAEYRESFELEAGRVIIELGNGRLIRSTERLQPGAEIVSDTYGMIIGRGNPRCSTPVAISGRVLAYPYEDRMTFAAGDAVCSGPNGTISKMTREEIKEYPERIIGTVSEVPEYETWGQNNIAVNGRIWIRLR